MVCCFVDRAGLVVLRDVLELPHVDVGYGWLILGLPPSEVAVHPGGVDDPPELLLMCADVDAFVADMAAKGVECGAVEELRWGRLTRITLPGSIPAGTWTIEAQFNGATFAPVGSIVLEEGGQYVVACRKSMWSCTGSAR